MKKYLSLIIAVIALAGCLTACTEEGVGAPAPGNADSVVTTEDPADATQAAPSQQQPTGAEPSAEQIKTANKNAKAGFSALTDAAADMLASGKDAVVAKTPGAVPVSSFENSSDPFEKAVYAAIDSHDGYVYYEFDPIDVGQNNFIQWSESADGSYIAQYPTRTSSADGIAFGKRS